jgi:CubicO group peptidase (beta-lactamase class C family)
MYDIGKEIASNFSGVISVVKENNVLFQNAYGYSDIPNKIKNEMDTRFATASAGKFFVAIAIMQLIEHGKLRLSDKIGTILDFELNSIDPNITILQLLNHTSGIPDYFDESVMEEYAELWINIPNYRIRKSRDILPLFINNPMMYEPGLRFQYNNSGYVILGIVIEIKTNMPFDMYLEKNVFEKAGMKNTGYYELDRLPAKCASAYILDAETGDYYTNIYSVDAKGTGAGGAFTTISDVENLWNSLNDGKIVSTETINKMFEIQASNDSRNYGLGVWLARYQNRLIPFFQGCDPGVSFVSSYDSATNSMITIMSNVCDDVWDIEAKINKEIRNLTTVST